MQKETERSPARISRRGFLGALAAGAVAVGTRGVLKLGRAHADSVPSVPLGQFGRLFGDLPPFAEATPKVKAALTDIGKPGGLLDAADTLSAGPVALIVDPALSVNNPNNTTHTAGTTFMGQFMDHDMTFDGNSTLGNPFPTSSSQNLRTPAFDLDTLYGAGPMGSPQMFEQAQQGIKFKIESGGQFEDLPRTSGGTAIIGDPRNDENMMIAGLHAAFMLFHNHAVDVVKAETPGKPPMAVFEAARRLTTWHYQWTILYEFLPLFVGQAVVDDVVAHGRMFYNPPFGQAFIPVEFQGAAFRFGHTMVRPSYRANMKGQSGQPFFGFIFDPSQQGQADPADLRGGARAPRRFIGWQTFFDFGVDPFTGLHEVKPNKRIDTKIATPLFHLPLGTIPTHDPPTALAQRNLLRGLTWQLPSGQSIAQKIGAPTLTKADLKELKGYGVGLDTSTPLWYYVLKEGELLENGLRLGPVGGRIVAEVIIGLLQTDPSSFLTAQPSWTPTLPAPFSGTGDFRMVDFLTFAGVDPASRGQ
jgi:Animal haem peroxidase